MKLGVVALGLLLGVLSPASGSYREHKHFTPKDAGTMTRALLGDLSRREKDFPGGIFGRAILTEKTSVGVRLNLEENGQIQLKFDLALEKKKDGYIASSQDGVDDRRTLVFRPVDDPKFRWHLDARALKELELRLSNPASRVWDLNLYHEILLSEASGDILQSSSTVTVRVWTVDQAMELVEAYYSRHPESTPLWEDG